MSLHEKSEHGLPIRSDDLWSSQVDTTPSIKFAKIHEDAKIPRRSEPGSVGLDLFSREQIMIRTGKRCVCGTGIIMENNYPNTYGRIAPRSGLAFKHGIIVLGGVIDRSYRGEIKVILFNSSDCDYTFEVNDRIAQLIIEQSRDQLVIQESDLNRISKTERGNSGFGSSGY